MKLNFSGMAFLVAELTKSEMFAIYLMGVDKEMPDQVTKADLVRIIQVLCKKLNWIEQDHAEALTPNSGNGKAVKSIDFSSSTVSEQTNYSSLDTDPLKILTDSSQLGFKTAKNDVESDRNLCAYEIECQENYDCDIIKSEAITSNENIDLDTNVLNIQYNFERNRSMGFTKNVLHKAKVETAGMASDLNDLQPYNCWTCNQKFFNEKALEAHVFMTHENNDTKLSSFANNLETI